MDTPLLSVVIRTHSHERLAFLDEALFSLATQEWAPVEAVITVQNPDAELLAEIERRAALQPWDEGCGWQIVPVEVAPGVDGRSILLNRGIESAKGRYLAFLDDDDVVYHHAYVTMIGALQEGEAAFAIGGCRTSRVRWSGDHWYVTRKERDYTWGSTRYDLFVNNFVPIHCYVIDRARLGDFELRFDESMTMLEDYEFLLRLAARFAPDMRHRFASLCEYRIREDGSNSVPHNENAPSEAVTAIEQAREVIAARKQQLTCIVSGPEMMELSAALRDRDRLRQERDRLWMKAARRLGNVLDNHPGLRERLSRPVETVARLVRRGRGGRS